MSFIFFLLLLATILINIALNSKLEDSILDPIEYYTRLTGRTGGREVDRKVYELKDFEFILDLKLSNKKDNKVIKQSYRFRRLPDIKVITIRNIRSDDNYVRAFLLNVFPLH